MKAIMTKILMTKKNKNHNNLIRTNIQIKSSQMMKIKMKMNKKK